MTTFDEFFAEHYDEVVRTLALAVGDRGRAEDAAQEAFARAYRKWPTVAAMERPVGWVVVVGVNQMKRWITRGEKHAHPAPTSPGRDTNQANRRGHGIGTAPDLADTVAAGTSLHAALEQLGPRQRATVVLRYLCDLPTAEVARALGCSPGTVKSALSAALANLRVELTEPEAQPITNPTAAPASEPIAGEEVRDAHR